MASDGSLADRTPSSRTSEHGFAWVSSSPSPAEVASLEARFPEVVRIPEAELQEGMEGWLHCAVLARSFMKWVPIEAYLREFRRAGISGAIVPVSLAFRCCIFRFEDPMACELVLNRPWVINGQIIATEAWHPEFFPAKDSISSALVWMRLPNLPLEFWKVDSLRAISEQAGLFYCADAATLAKNRGCFARVAVRVDLCGPLRPGTRVQGIRGTFWQQFAYEAFEGFCPKCGSLHLVDPCSEEAMAERDGSGGSFVFGPWLAAVRQRRPPVAPSGKPAPASGKPSAHAAVPGSPSRPAAEVLGQEEGWKVPGKLRRRRPPADGQSVSLQQALVGRKSGIASVDVPASQVASGMQDVASGKKAQVLEDGGKDSSHLVAVPVSESRAGFKLAEKEKVRPNQSGSSEYVKPQPLVTDNPFASLDLDPNEGGLVKNCIMVSGPLKRARPADCMPPRSIPKLDKKKGKGKGRVVNCRVDFIPSPQGLPLPSSGQTSNQEDVMVTSASPEGSLSEPPSAVFLGQVSPNTDAEPEAPQDCYIQNRVDGSGSVGPHSDSLMLEDPVAVPTTPI